MKYIYIDESGDLGFNFTKAATSRYFIISAIQISDPKTADKIIKKTYAKLTKKMRVKRSGLPLHANHESGVIKTRLLKLLASHDAKSFTLLLDKTKFPQLAAQNTHELYTSLCAELLLQMNLPSDCEIFLSRFEMRRGISEKRMRVLTELLVSRGVDARISTRIHHLLSGLMVVDFVAHAAYLKYELAQNEFYEIIAKKDKTLAAFAGIHPVPIRQGNYLPGNSVAKTRAAVNPPRKSSAQKRRKEQNG